MKHRAHQLALRFLGKEWDRADEHERRVLLAMAEQIGKRRDAPGSRDARTTGERVADKVAAFGGSWTFIGIFVATLLAWIALNSWILASRAFDPYPYILLNLLLSCLASLQAPVILMSQNRQAANDRQRAEEDYEINLQAEIEIKALHEKLDQLADQIEPLLRKEPIPRK
ncbi:MAG TPA: DUF1003 domain-containing protein [Candidatus Polarisedimenticolia bacterium]|jgi:uncharacterized membrane protein|nr:DUF1003 domain-containing protein [Candidatus Polarisedimenticolia bacterium]